MNLVFKGILLSSAVVLVLVGAVLLVRFQNTPLTFSVQPLPIPAPILTTANVENLLGRDFRIVRSVRQVPSVVKQAFSSQFHQPFEMVNPTQQMSTDYNLPYSLPNVHNTRFVFGAFSIDTAVLVFEVAGQPTNSRNAVLFWYAKGGGKWGAMLNNDSVHDINGLRDIVHSGQFIRYPLPAHTPFLEGSNLKYR